MINKKKVFLYTILTILIGIVLAFVFLFDGINRISSVFDGVNKKKTFSSNITYVCETNIQVDDDYTYCQVGKLSFSKNGEYNYFYQYNDLDNNIIEQNEKGTYQVDSNIIMFNQNNNITYGNYYKGYILFENEYGIILFRKQNTILSSKDSTKIVGYYFSNYKVKKDTLISQIFTGKYNEYGYYLPIYENGTLGKKRYLYSDQIMSNIDTSNCATYYIKVKIDDKEYKLVLNVI